MKGIVILDRIKIDVKKQYKLFIEVVFNNPLDQSFTYKVPDELIDRVMAGQRVIVPFGKRRLMGYIISVHSNEPIFALKEISELCDNSAIFGLSTINLAKWVSSYYLCSLGEALSLFVPREVKEKTFSLSKIKQKDLLTLNDEQNTAFQLVRKSINENIFYPYLLFGATASGKTEVYKYLAKEVVNKNKQALILVPEIALTPQTIKRFQEVFRDRIAILHSKLNKKERYYNWMQINNGTVDIILGARSSIFLPIERLGIIIIDEEHEYTYKSGDTPRYHVRQIAFKIGKTLGIPVVLGSATPSIESFYHSRQNRLKLLYLKKKHSVYQKQKVTLIDMRNESSIISKSLIEKIALRLEKKEQVMIFLNRRGYSPFLICKSCGYTFKCPSCDISLTYHQSKRQMLCHYCGYSTGLYKTCISCNKKEISLISYGTERVEELLKEIFVNANIARMDLDTTRCKGSSEKLLEQFRKKKVDILIGTQMIAKGLHFPNVTLVGVIMADLSLNLPDFRASEKTFSLLTQISGRAGRGRIQGETVIQTYLPDNYVIKLAVKQDYEEFYKCEIAERKKFLYPPFSRLVKLLIRGKNEETVINKSNELLKYLNSIVKKGIELLGPAPAPLSKLHNNYRWQIILKGNRINDMQYISKKANEFFKQISSIYLEIDIDPLSMM